jgi:hypothetical protein
MQPLWVEMHDEKLLEMNSFKLWGAVALCAVVNVAFAAAVILAR